MAGLIAMASVFVVVGIEMFFAMRGAGHVHGGEFEMYKSVDGGEGEAYHDHAGENGTAARSKRTRRPQDIMLGDVNASTDNLMAGRSPSFSVGQPSPMPASARSQEDDTRRRKSVDSDDDELDLDLDELTTNAGLLNGAPKRTSTDSVDHLPHQANGSSHAHHAHAPAHDLEADSALNQKALLQCLLLEAGILFHSIFIGMALSVTTGPAFIILLIAISFHQTFEGLALGSRIASLAFPRGSIKPWLMALAYGTTTPIGQGIGLAIHRLYDPESEVGLLTVGVMNAVSSGLLLFAGLVELLAEDFLSDASYETLRGKRRMQACGSVVAGAALMALVGAWA